MAPYGKVDSTAPPNGWNQWGNHVLAELKHLNERLKVLEDGQIKLLIQMEGLRTRSTIFGAIGGAVLMAFVKFAGDVFMKGGGG
jgi:hypothetical protein